MDGRDEREKLAVELLLPASQDSQDNVGRKKAIKNLH
jgi:hypothetical protein